MDVRRPRIGAHRKINRVAIHAVPKHEVLAHLVRLGYAAEPVVPQSRYDFLIDESVRIALRVAYPSSSWRRVRSGGRRYSYKYRAWNFNFHHRGEVGERYCDFFVCIPLAEMQKPDLSRAFVIPWESISGKTFYLPDSRRAYEGKFAIFRNAWHLLTKGNGRARG